MSVFRFTKNAAKSFSYAGSAVLKNKLGGSFKLVSDIKEGISASKDEVLDVSRIFKENIYEGNIKKGIENSFEGLKQGKFHRSEEDESKDAMASFGFDDDEFNFDDNDDFDFGEDTKSSSPVESNNYNKTTNVINKKTNIVLGDSTGTQNAIASSSKIQAGISIGTSKILSANIRRSNELLDTVVQIGKEQNEFLSQIYNDGLKGATAFRATSMLAIGDMLMQLNDINKAQQVSLGIQGVNLDGSPLQKALKDKYDRIFDESGDMNFGNYTLKVLKKVKSGLTDLEMFGDILKNPLDLATQSIVEKVLPKSFDSALTRFEKIVSGVPASIMLGFEDWAENSSGGLLGNLKKIVGKSLGISETDLSETATLANYNKQVVPFDGLTRKSIVEVIPTYLSKILNAIKGGSTGDELIFDPSTGGFRSRSQLYREYEEKKQGKFGSTGVSKEITTKLLDREFTSDEQKKAYEKEISKLMSGAVSSKGKLNGNLNLGDVDPTLLKEFNEIVNSLGYSSLSQLQKEKLGARSERASLNSILGSDEGQAYRALLTDGQDSNAASALKQYKNYSSDGTRELFGAKRKSGLELSQERIDEELRGDSSFNTAKGKLLGIKDNLTPTNFLNAIRNPIALLESGTNNVSDLIGRSLFGKRGEGQEYEGSNKDSLFNRLFGESGFFGKKGLLFNTESGLFGKPFNLLKENLFGETGFFGRKGFLFNAETGFLGKPFLNIKTKLFDKDGLFGKDGYLLNPETGLIGKSFNNLFGESGFFGKDGYLFNSESGIFNKTIGSLFKENGLFGKDGGFANSIFKPLFGEKGFFSEGGTLDEKIFSPFKERVFGENGFFGKNGPINVNLVEPLKNSIVGENGLLAKFGFGKEGDGLFNKQGFLGSEGRLFGTKGFFGSEGDLFGTKGFFGKEGKLFGKKGIFGAEGKLFGKGSFLNTYYNKVFGESGFFGKKGYLFKDEGIFGKEGKIFGDSGWLGKNGPLLGKKGFLGEEGVIFGEKGYWTRFKNFTSERWNLLTENLNEKIWQPAKNFVKTELWSPFAELIKKDWQRAKAWSHDNLIKPLQGVFEPFTAEFKLQMENVKTWFKEDFIDSIKAGASSFASTLDEMFASQFGKPFSEMIKDNVISPIAELTNSLKESVSKVLGSILKAPINFIKGISDDLRAKHGRIGLRDSEGNYLKGDDLKVRIKGAVQRQREGIATPSDIQFLKSTDAKALSKVTLDLDKKEQKEENSRVGKIKKSLIGKIKKNKLSDFSDSVLMKKPVEFLKSVLEGKTVFTKKDSSIPDITSGSSEEDSSLFKNLFNKLGSEKGSSTSLSDSSKEESSLGLSLNNKSKPSSSSSEQKETNESTLSLKGSATAQDSHNAAVKSSNILSNIFSFVKNNLGGLGKNVARIARQLGALDAEISGDDYKGKKGIIRRLWDITMSPFRAVKSIVEKTTDAVLSIPGRIMDGVVKIGISVVSAGGKIISTAVESISPIVEGLAYAGEKLVSATGTIISTGTKIIGQIAETSASVIGTIFEKGTKALSTAVIGVAKSLSPLVTLTGKIASSLVDVTSSLVTGIAKAGKEIISGLAGIVKSVGKAAWGITKKVAGFGTSMVTRSLGINSKMKKSDFIQLVEITKSVPLGIFNTSAPSFLPSNMKPSNQTTEINNSSKIIDFKKAREIKLKEKAENNYKNDLLQSNRTSTKHLASIKKSSSILGNMFNILLSVGGMIGGLVSNLSNIFGFGIGKTAQLGFKMLNKIPGAKTVGTALTKIPGIGGILEKGKGIFTGTENPYDAAKRGLEQAKGDKGIISTIIDKIKTIIPKKWAKAIPSGIGKKISSKLSKKALTSIAAKFFGPVGLAAALGFAGYDAVKGYNSAEEIFGITPEFKPFSAVDKAKVAAASALTSFIPFLDTRTVAGLFGVKKVKNSSSGSSPSSIQKSPNGSIKLSGSAVSPVPSATVEMKNMNDTVKEETRKIEEKAKRANTAQTANAEKTNDKIVNLLQAIADNTGIAAVTSQKPIPIDLKVDTQTSPEQSVKTKAPSNVNIFTNPSQGLNREVSKASTSDDIPDEVKRIARG